MPTCPTYAKTTSSRQRWPKARSTASSTSGRCCSTSACRRRMPASSRRPASIPRSAPTTWDEFIANAQKVQESGAAPYGLIFDNRDWRSLIPVTHSISTDVYTPDGLFRYDSDAAIEALEIMKRMMQLDQRRHPAPRQRRRHGARRPSGLRGRSRLAYYFKYQNAPLRNSATWPDPSQAVAWHAARRPKAASAARSSGTPARCSSSTARTSRRRSSSSRPSRRTSGSGRTPLSGNADEGIFPVGQLPVTQSLWATWEASPPDWLTANPWVFEVCDSLADASAIAPSILAIKQFDTARPVWHKYLSGETPDAKTAPTRRRWTPCALSTSGRPARTRSSASLHETRSERPLSPGFRQARSPNICRSSRQRRDGLRRGSAYPRRQGGPMWHRWPRRVSAVDGAAAGQDREERAGGTRRSTSLRTYPYLLPAIFFFVGWQILPIYDALRLSFTDDKFLDQVSAELDRPAELPRRPQRRSLLGGDPARASSLPASLCPE